MVSAVDDDSMMTNDFGKHYASMYTGSMRGKGALMFAVMGYVIANQVPESTESDRMVVEINPEVVAFLLGEGQEEVDETLRELMSEDKKSRSKEQGGRRLVKLGEFLYWVVNGRKYREWNREERRREQNREAKRRERGKVKQTESSEATENRKSLGVKGKPLPGERAAVAAMGDGDEGQADRIGEAARGGGGKGGFKPIDLRPEVGEERF